MAATLTLHNNTVHLTASRTPLHIITTAATLTLIAGIALLFTPYPYYSILAASILLLLLFAHYTYTTQLYQPTIMPTALLAQALTTLPHTTNRHNEATFPTLPNNPTTIASAARAQIRLATTNHNNNQAIENLTTKLGGAEDTQHTIQQLLTPTPRTSPILTLIQGGKNK